MLKMVVSDLDGTLLNGENQLPDKVFQMIEALKRKNILFAVASGRKICELQKLFSKVKDNIIFIACDGAYAVYRGEILAKEVIKPKILEKITFNCEKLSDKNGDIVKIIAKNEDISKRQAEYIRINRLLSLIYDDFGIKEYVGYGINKGTVLSQILTKFNIDKREVIVFGDNYNDMQMLKAIPNSYAMKNSKNEIKRICRYQTDDVCKTVLSIIENTAEVKP